MHQSAALTALAAIAPEAVTRRRAIGLASMRAGRIHKEVQGTEIAVIAAGKAIIAQGFKAFTVSFIATVGAKGW
jgi:hypothetical protein